jgi:alpha-beta hydrolase superfamily lysophospholipase
MIIKEVKIAVSKNFSLFAREWVSGSKPKALVVLVHGLADHGGRFIQVAGSFVKDDIVFLAPDLRGHGLSAGKRGHFASLEQVMEDLNAAVNFIIKKNPGIPVFIYGQSMGGNLALCYAFRFRQKIAGVIASSPWFRLTKKPPLMSRLVATVLNPFFPSLLFPDGLNPDDLCHVTEICDRYRKDPLVHHKISVRTYNVITQAGIWLLKNAQEFKMPVLLMHGDADPITSFSSSRLFAEKAGDQCLFKSWETLFHELHNEAQGKEVTGYMVGWLNSVLKSKS